ncbi:MAG: DUF4435 domain-containing protein [Gemmatimonadetes bacterium]|nr:DUF4435 domain-containing protein [Gemmatimonadota bacterium]
MILLVEGKTDRYFYNKVLAPVCRAEGVSHAVRIARELPQQAGGKATLLAYYRYLRRKGSLVSDLGGKRTLIVIVLDKDVDDLCRRRMKSDHVVYTEYYDVENYLYRHGDLVEAAAAASGLTADEVDSMLGDDVAWRLQVQQNWRDWLCVCVFSATRRLRRGGNYGVIPSPVNTPPRGAVDPAKLQARLTLMEAEHNRGARSFRRAWRRVQAAVDEMLARGEADRVFKGKWYSWILAQDLVALADSREAHLHSLETRLPHHLAQSIPSDAAWAAPLRIRMRQLIVRADMSAPAA